MILPENMEAVGAVLAIVRRADSTADPTEKPYKLDAGPIIGITAAAIVVLLSAIFGVACYKKRQRKRLEKMQRKPIDDIELNSNSMEPEIDTRPRR